MSPIESINASGEYNFYATEHMLFKSHIEAEDDKMLTLFVEIVKRDKKIIVRANNKKAGVNSEIQIHLK